MNLHIPIFDGHNDPLLRLFVSKHNNSFFDSSQGHIDPTCAGGFAGGFFAVFVPSVPDKQPAKGLPFAYALETALAVNAPTFPDRSAIRRSGAGRTHGWRHRQLSAFSVAMAGAMLRRR